MIKIVNETDLKKLLKNRTEIIRNFYGIGMMAIGEGREFNMLKSLSHIDIARSHDANFVKAIVAIANTRQPSLRLECTI